MQLYFLLLLRFNLMTRNKTLWSFFGQFLNLDPKVFTTHTFNCSLATHTDDFTSIQPATLSST